MARRAVVTGAVLGAAAMAAITGALALSGIADADGLGLKPGLWIVRLEHQVVDGHDVSQQLTESIAKAQVALSNLSPEQRARVQQLLHERGATPDANASFRICVSPSMAARDLPVLDKDDSCRPTVLSRTAGRTTFRVDCTVSGTHIQGKGEAISAGDVITTRSDITTQAEDHSTHSMHNETRMQFVGADCGGLQSPR